jgi:hypothetical protein
LGQSSHDLIVSGNTHTPASTSQVAGITVMHHHTWLNGFNSRWFEKVLTHIELLGLLAKIPKKCTIRKRMSN